MKCVTLRIMVQDDEAANGIAEQYYDDAVNSLDDGSDFVVLYSRVEEPTAEDLAIRAERVADDDF